MHFSPSQMRRLNTLLVRLKHDKPCTKSWNAVNVIESLLNKIRYGWSLAIPVSFPGHLQFTLSLQLCFCFRSLYYLEKYFKFYLVW